MPPISLLRECLVQLDGVSPSLEVRRASGKLLVVTLGITRVLEQQSLEVSIWGSRDGENWDEKPLVAFPPRFSWTQRNPTRAFHPRRRRRMTARPA